MSEAVRPVLQIAGTVVGGIVGGPIGAAIGGSIGSAVGGAIAPSNVGEGPRLNDLKVVSSAYGQPIPLVYGTKNRIAGNIIWSSDIQESRSDREVSKGNEVTEYSYSVDIAVAICEGPMLNVTKIWANGKVIWEGNTIAQDVTGAAEDYTAADLYATALEDAATSCGLEENPECTAMYAQAEAARAIADSALARKNAAEAALAAYNTGGEGWSYVSALSPGGTFRFYPGSYTQDPDPTIQAAKGESATPAYRGLCYMVIKDLALSSFGNRIPNLEFEIAGVKNTLREVLIDIHERSGIDQYDYSVSAPMSLTAVDGYVISREMSSLAAIAQLEQAYFFDTTEQFGEIRHIARGGHSKVTFDPGDLGARQTRDGVVQPIVTTRMHDEALPTRASITYRDYDRDYQPNTQVAERQKGASDNVINAEFAITMTNDYARQAVDRMLFDPWTSRIGFNAKGHPKFDFLNPGDVVGVPVAGAVVPFRLINVGRGADGLIEMEARADDPFAFQSTSATQGVGSSAINTSPVLQGGGDTFVYLFNAPIIDPTESDTAFSWAADADSSSWTGGRLFRSADAVSYGSIKNAPDRNITGTVSAALGSGPAEIWDQVNEIDVVLHYEDHALDSKTDSQVLNNANACWIGAADGSSGEVLQFTTATLLSSSPKTYRLSGLLRGRRGTEHAIDSHGTDEVFVLLETGYYKNADFGASDIDATRYYKGVSASQSVDNVIALQEFVNTGEKAKPRSVVHVRGERDTSNNLTGTFRRRIRGYNSVFGSPVEPLDEASEAYEIDIMSGPTVLRTIEVSSETFSYSAAQQTTDGLTPGNPVTGNIYQISASVGRGHARSFMI